MVIAALALILMGSFAAAILMYWLDFSWKMIALGYVAGGWAGLFTGLAALVLLDWRSRRRAERDCVDVRPQPFRR